MLLVNIDGLEKAAKPAQVDQFYFAGVGQFYTAANTEPLKIPSLQFQACDDRIEIDRLAAALKGVVPVEQDVPPCRRRNFCDECQRLAVAGRLVLGHQPRQDCRVVENDRVGDQPCALVADLDFNVGATGQFLLTADLAMAERS